MRKETVMLKEKLELIDRLSEACAGDEISSSVKIELLRDIAIGLLDEIDSMRSDCTPDVERGIDLFDEVRRFETGLIVRALKLTDGSQIRAARLLGINPTTLNYKIKRYNITFGSRNSPLCLDPLMQINRQESDAGVHEFEMAVGNVMHYLAHHPSALAIGRVELRVIQAGDCATEVDRCVRDLLDRRGALRPRRRVASFAEDGGQQRRLVCQRADLHDRVAAHAAQRIVLHLERQRHAPLRQRLKVRPHVRRSGCHLPTRRGVHQVQPEARVHEAREQQIDVRGLVGMVASRSALSMGLVR